MKTSITAVLAVLATISYTNAQAPNKAQRHLNIDTVNCNELKGQPQVCLLNNTDEQVTDIACETKGWFSSGERGVTVPKGGIGPHSLVVVNMKSCHTNLIFYVLNGPERKVMNVNTDTSTMIEVPVR